MSKTTSGSAGTDPAHSLVRMKLFGVYAGSRVAVAEGGWLDFTEDLKVLQEAKPLQPKELEGIGTFLDNRRAWLAQRGIDYIFMPVPDRSTVYPEHVPSGFGPMPSPRALTSCWKPWPKTRSSRWSICAGRSCAPRRSSGCMT